MLTHEAYCFRNISKCSECDEPIDKTNQESHKKTHEKVIVNIFLLN